MKFRLCFFAAVSVLCAGHAAAAPSNLCGQLANSFGPFDYNNGANATSLQTVEPYHFTEEVEQGIRGATGPLGGDIDYTLRAFPNHPRALATMARIGLRDKVVQVPGAKYPVECYFIRAMQFRPDDATVRATYASYLLGQGKNEAALEQMKAAVELDPENPTLHYNLGILYLKRKQYDLANQQAQLAYAREFPLAGLRQMLKEVGQWKEAAP